eukprot:6213071-Pleurochrysis_carterae.AAC.2
MKVPRPLTHQSEASTLRCKPITTHSRKARGHSHIRARQARSDTDQGATHSTRPRDHSHIRARQARLDTDQGQRIVKMSEVTHILERDKHGQIRTNGQRVDKRPEVTHTSERDKHA